MPFWRMPWDRLGRAEMQSLGVKVPTAHIWVAGRSLGQPDFTAQKASGLRPLDFSHPCVSLFSAGRLNRGRRFWGFHLVMVRG